MEPDYDKHRVKLRKLGLTEEQENDIISALWHVMNDLVDRAHGFHPAQQVSHNPLAEFADGETYLVESKDKLGGEFARTSRQHATQEGNKT